MLTELNERIIFFYIQVKSCNKRFFLQVYAEINSITSTLR